MGARCWRRRSEGARQHPLELDLGQSWLEPLCFPVVQMHRSWTAGSARWLFVSVVMRPLPCRLLLCDTAAGRLHVVVAEDVAEHAIIVVTVYRPSARRWHEGFRRRR